MYLCMNANKNDQKQIKTFAISSTNQKDFKYILILWIYLFTILLFGKRYGWGPILLLYIQWEEIRLINIPLLWKVHIQ